MTDERFEIEATKRIIEKVGEWDSKKQLSQHEKAVMMIAVWRDEIIARLAAEEQMRELKAKMVLLENQLTPLGWSDTINE